MSSRLAEKYCIPCEAVIKMVKDGVISCSWPMRDEIYERYTELKGTKPQLELFDDIASEFKVSVSTVKQAIQRLR